MTYDYVAIPDAEVPQAVEPVFQHAVTTYASEANKTANVASSDPVTPSQLLERSGAADGEFLKPSAAARNRLDQRRITCRAVLLLRKSGQNQSDFSAAPPEGGCRRQLDGVVASVLQGR